MGQGKRVYLNGPGYLLFVIIVKGTGAFSRDFIINLASQCRFFSRALQTEKLKDPLFP